MLYPLKNSQLSMNTVGPYGPSGGERVLSMIMLLVASSCNLHLLFVNFTLINELHKNTLLKSCLNTLLQKTNYKEFLMIHITDSFTLLFLVYHFVADISSSQRMAIDLTKVDQKTKQGTRKTQCLISYLIGEGEVAVF